MTLTVSAAILVPGCDGYNTVGPEEQPAMKLLGSGESNRAVVIKEGFCVLFAGTGAQVSAERLQKVGTHSGAAKFSCHAKVRPSPTGRAVHYDAYHNPIEPELVCGITLPSGLFLTTQWRETVSASGRATLVCRVPQGSEPTEPF